MCTFTENIETEVPTAENRILSRTLFNDEAVKIVAFGFSSDQTVRAHRADGGNYCTSRSEAEPMLGVEKKNVRAGVFVHMVPQVPH